MTQQVAGFSGGDDSTAMVLRLAELGEPFGLIFTPAHNKLPDLFVHVREIAARIGRDVIEPPNRPLTFWIDHHQALPSWRMRWCTRQTKIEPTVAWLLQHPGSTLCVGLRADEETREGIYGPYARYRYPLREWGWTEADVQRYLAQQDVQVPPRTNCALCYDQRLYEWYYLWRDHRDAWEEGEALEAKHGHTFRSDGRDSWPAALKDLRARFERGDRPPRATDQMDLFADPQRQRCRVCSL
jgi:3'-phosphoadenosine 5'-phosphosulfate sulfotransferase (PAPS reductase)/FAD synthetase